MLMKGRNLRLEQLKKQDPIAMGMLGKQPIREKAYRPLTYVLTTEEVDKKIFFNLLTHEIITVDLSELKSSEISKYFIENWYLVPEGHDDQQLVDECRAVLALMDSRPINIHAFHIFTTLDCNARCFYCFEKRIAGSNMSMETATRVIEYIEEQANGDPVKIVWFGGEPLFNYPVIDYIAEGLWSKKIQFESDMISNGLLFDSALIGKAKKRWNVKSVQITLDGTRQVYNKVKAFVTDVEDPFDRVMRNIKYILRNEIKVRIRLNIGLYNYSDIRNLVDFLCEEFKGEKNIYVYTSPLTEIIQYTDDEKEFMYKLLNELDDKLNPLFGKKDKKDFSEKIANSFCMASGRETVTILPDGKVGICEGLTDVLLGDIYTKEMNVKVREDFGRRFYREDKCRSCPLYPDCYIVNGCPNKDDKEGCDPINVQMQIRGIKEKLKTRCRLGALGDGQDLDGKRERLRKNRMKLKYKFATQKVGSNVVAVAIEEDALKYNEILRMNSTGAFILEQLQDDISYAELTERILQKYDTDKETAEKILVDFLGMLSGKELLLNGRGELLTEISLPDSENLF